MTIIPDARTLFPVFFMLYNIMAMVSWVQQPPSPEEIKHYKGIFSDVFSNNLDQLHVRINSGVDLEQRDNNGRTVLLIATHLRENEIVQLLLENGADSNAKDNQNYDMITIAAVNNDIEIINIGLRHGADPGAITSPYLGTALIAAAHLGHVETVDTLIKAGAPLDHVNNLGWTALIESIVLGDGGPSHVSVLQLLVDSGANLTLSDRDGRTPLQLAKQYGFTQMIKLLEHATLN